MKLTYRQAYDRIVDAYFRDEMKPYYCQACFVGNLLGGQIEWATMRVNNSVFGVQTYFHSQAKEVGMDILNNYGYSPKQITDIENLFINTLETGMYEYDCDKSEKAAYRATYEERLFNAMSSTLDMLKKIHEENGEITETPIFTKRSLKQTSCAQ